MFMCMCGTPTIISAPCSEMKQATGLDVMKFATSFTWLTSYTSDLCPGICVLVCIVKMTYFIYAIIRLKKKVLNTERSF